MLITEPPEWGFFEERRVKYANNKYKFDLKSSSPNDIILDWSKLKGFAGDNLKVDESSSHRLKTLREEDILLIMSNFFFSSSVFLRLVLQARKTRAVTKCNLIPPPAL